MDVPLGDALGVDVVVEAEGSATTVRCKLGEGVIRGACGFGDVPTGVTGVIVDLMDTPVESPCL